MGVSDRERTPLVVPLLALLLGLNVLAVTAVVAFAALFSGVPGVVVLGVGSSACAVAVIATVVSWRR